VGKDAGFLIELLDAAGVDTTQIQTLDAASGHAMIQVDDAGENSIVINGGSNRLLTTEFIDTALGHVGRNDWLLLQNEINDLAYVLEHAAAAGLKVAFNIAPPDDRLSSYPLDQVSLFILNTHEAMALANRENLDNTVTELSRRFSTAKIVITQGSSGLLFTPGNGKPFTHLDAFPAVMVDGTAAGDAFTGYLLAELADGRELVAALRFASAAGALAVTIAGAASSIPERSAVEAFVAANG
jgi:ribokinase